MLKTKEEYIYLQKDLGIIGDFIHAYRKDIADEFIKNLHHYKLPKDHFNKFFPKDETNHQVVPKVLNDKTLKQLHGGRAVSRNPLDWNLHPLRRLFKKKKKSHKFSYGAGQFNVMSVLKFLPKNIQKDVFKSLFGQSLKTQIAILWHLYKGRKNMYETMRGHAIREVSTENAWQMKPILYNQNWVWEPESKMETTVWQQHDGITFGTRSTYDTIKQYYPKLTEMVDKLRAEYGIDSVQKVTYSILVANGDISVHTGRDNIHSKYVRCHIPLIIPEHTKDELYLEANADKVYWTETWGFDNQTPHTAKNETNYNRLVFIIDISRDALCIAKKKKSSKGIAYIKRLITIFTNQGREYN